MKAYKEAYVCNEAGMFVCAYKMAAQYVCKYLEFIAVIYLCQSDLFFVFTCVFKKLYLY